MLKLQDINVTAGEKQLLYNISLEIKKGEAIALIGESGSGKTTILKSIMGILGGTCKMTSGSISIDEQGITGLKAGKRRSLAGTTIGFIPQNPMSAFDSRIRIGNQLKELFSHRLGISKRDADQVIEEALLRVNLIDTARIRRCFPSELSGGMLQRVAVAVLLVLKPEYILADEPTSALDEDNMRMLLKELEQQKKHAGILLVSHDIEAIKTLCSRVHVIEKGHIIEENTTRQLFNAPRQKWTKMFVSAYQKPDEGGWEWKEL